MSNRSFRPLLSDHAPMNSAMTTGKNLSATWFHCWKLDTVIWDSFEKIEKKLSKQKGRNGIIRDIPVLHLNLNCMLHFSDYHRLPPWSYCWPNKPSAQIAPVQLPMSIEKQTYTETLLVPPLCIDAMAGDLFPWSDSTFQNVINKINYFEATFDFIGWVPLRLLSSNFREWMDPTSTNMWVKSSVMIVAYQQYGTKNIMRYNVQRSQGYTYIVENAVLSSTTFTIFIDFS